MEGKLSLPAGMPRAVTPVTPVIAAHAGIGAWGVFYQNED
jgi:fatty acid-binding protein DegV